MKATGVLPNATAFSASCCLCGFGFSLTHPLCCWHLSCCLLTHIDHCCCSLRSLCFLRPQNTNTSTVADRGLHLTLLDAATDEQQMDWERLGFEQIARGRVASVLIATTAVDAHTLNPRGEDIDVAVEDGTPRVAVPVPGLPSGKSTLQLLAERILKLQQLAAAETFGRNAPVTRHIQW